eukprot:gene15964-17570_t
MAADIINIATNGEVENLRDFMANVVPTMEEGGDIINERNELGKSPLEIAAMLGRTEMLQELKTHGADVNLENSSGYCALHLAAMWGWIDCVTFLVDNGADLQRKTKFGERPRECAMRFDKQDCAKYLDQSEARQDLKKLVQSFKEIVSDPEKHMGKLSKDDRVTGNKACDEKANWVEANKETATVEEVNSATEQLREILKPILSKLKEQSDLSVSSKQRPAKSPLPTTTK